MLLWETYETHRYSAWQSADLLGAFESLGGAGWYRSERRSVNCCARRNLRIFKLLTWDLVLGKFRIITSALHADLYAVLRTSLANKGLHITQRWKRNSESESKREDVRCRRRKVCVLIGNYVYGNTTKTYPKLRGKKRFHSFSTMNTKT
jgi:hypothetical protein